MIIFNTIKKSQHYVKFCNKNHDFYRDGYDWSEHVTYIEGNLVKTRDAGDGCGCGCDVYVYNSVTIIGRIRAYDTKSIRECRINTLLISN